MSSTTSGQSGQNDTFTLPAFEDRLWQELARLHAEQQHTEQQGEENGSSRRPTRGNPRRRYLTAVAAVAAAASIAAVALVLRQAEDTTRTAPDGGVPASEPAADPTTDTTRPQPPPQPSPSPNGESSVEPRTEGLVSDAAVVVRESVFTSGTTLTYWIDESTGAFRSRVVDAAGNPVREEGVALELDDDGVPMVRQTFVDHLVHQYSVSPPRPPTDLAPARQHEILNGAIASGSLVADGTEVVDGRELLRFSGAGGRLVWADPASMRPVRESVPESIGQAYTTTHTYLPRTAVNLGLLDLTIPDGYRDVSPPA